MDTGFFANKTCLITGAGGGIGLGLTTALLERGAKVWMADYDQSKLEAGAAPLAEKYPGMVKTKILDVTGLAAFEELISEICGQGSLDLLANNAGIGCAGYLPKLSEEEIRRAVDVNIMGVINGCHAAIPHMVKQGGGIIVNLGSLASFAPLPWRSVYTATKFAVLGFTQCLRAELGWMESNIRLATVCPSTVSTDIWRGCTPRNAMSPYEAAQEILGGVERGDEIIPVTDHARQMFSDLWENPQQYQAGMEEMLKMYTPIFQTPEAARKEISALAK